MPIVQILQIVQSHTVNEDQVTWTRGGSDFVTIDTVCDTTTLRGARHIFTGAYPHRRKQHKPKLCTVVNPCASIRELC